MDWWWTTKAGRLWLTTVVCVLIGGLVALWAAETRSSVFRERSLYYVMNGSASATARILAASEASTAVGWISTLSWVLIGAGVVAAIAAIAVSRPSRSD